MSAFDWGCHLLDVNPGWEVVPLRGVQVLVQAKINFLQGIIIEFSFLSQVHIFYDDFLTQHIVYSEYIVI